MRKKFFINLITIVTLVLEGLRFAPIGTTVKGNIYHVERLELFTDQTYVWADERIIDQ